MTRIDLLRGPIAKPEFMRAGSVPWRAGDETVSSR